MQQKKWNAYFQDIICGDDVERSKPDPLILETIIERNNLIVVNGLKEKRKGVITRQRSTVNGIEQSVIDFVIIPNNLFCFLLE